MFIVVVHVRHLLGVRTPTDHAMPSAVCQCSAGMAAGVDHMHAMISKNSKATKMAQMRNDTSGQSHVALVHPVISHTSLESALESQY